jgi:glycosyltransferase involved in cell wall biosynthesis
MSDKFSILLVSHFLPPKHNAGTENYTLGLGKALQLKGYNVQLVCAEDWENGSSYWNGVTTELFEGLTVYRHHINWLKASDPNRILYDSPIIENWFDEFLRENLFDVSHVIHTYSLGVGVLRSIKRAKVPLVLTLMDFWFLCPSIQLVRSDGSLCDGVTTAWECQACLMANSGLFQRLKQLQFNDSINTRVLGALAHLPMISRHRGLRGMLLDIDHRKKVLEEAFSLPDAVLSHSYAVKIVFEKNFQKPVKVIHHGHDLSWLDPNFEKRSSNVVRFGYLGQIKPIKGVHLLIEAYRKAGFGEKARLEIWGDYSKNENYMDSLLTLVENSPSILFRGRYERKNLAIILSDIDVVIVPSLWYENAPLVIQEALATNTPVIASNLGGMAEAIIHDKNGLFSSLGVLMI